MTSPRVLLKAWELHPKKQLGQNFLEDPSTARMIAARADLSGDDRVLEIGAGLGALTIPVARLVRHVTAVETDAVIADLLTTELKTQNIANVSLIRGDILRLNWDSLLAAPEGPDGWVVMGNLPYNISSQVLFHLIEHRDRVKRAIFMFQKELAERLTARPGSRDYGRLTVMLAYCADARTLATVGAHLFFPRPKVDSEVLEIRFKPAPDFPADSEPFLFQVIKAAFGQRRKTLKNALTGSALPLVPQAAQIALETAGIDPMRRAETLTVREFVALSHALSPLLN